jgi:hypothetical protein
MINSFVKSFYLLICFIFISQCACAQNNLYQKEKILTIVSYNVENLFDTIDDPNKLDNEFLPDSMSRWNTENWLV